MTRLSFVFAMFAVVAMPAFAQEHGTEAPAATEQSAPTITVAEAVTGTVRDTVFASGVFEPVENVSVAPLVEGQQIEELFAQVGDRVEAGQVLARLSDAALRLQESQLEASRASAEAAVAQARASLAEAQAAADEAVRVRDRTVSLAADGTTSRAAADQAEASAATALARVEAAQQGLAAAEAQIRVAEAQIADVALNLQRTDVVTPVAGIVSVRNAQVGAIASAAGQPMFVIIRDGLLELQADVSESDLLKLDVGQTVDLRPVGLRQSLDGVVRLVEPTVDTMTRLGRVRISLTEPERVRAGLFAEAEILVEEHEALTLPVTAVAAPNDGAGESVLRVTADGSVELVEVTTGIRDGGTVEILEGLSPGDRVVARARAFVRPGDTINPVPAEPVALSSN
ncbi:efflux RND transporter periplasmic adaptor subunit [Rhodobacterales bacterium HKCCE3408]|nr:efflux RND transporter periplasmic adaptor subunit [Rhodobacterales bacterium HKCCE3408]